VSPAPKLRPTTAIDVVVSPDINLQQLSKLLESIAGGAGCRACGLLGIDLRLIGPDPAALKQVGISELAGVQSAVISQR
jgi:hypothetical protein